MSLLAEVVVEEWLNRQGYFTIRGIKLKIDEIDLLAMRPRPDERIELRHIEVQASFRPASYLTGKRSSDELVDHVNNWVFKKYRKPNKIQLLKSFGVDWTSELVIHKTRFQEEVELIRSHGIKILHLGDIVKELRSTDTFIKAASGSDLLELMHLASDKLDFP